MDNKCTIGVCRTHDASEIESVFKHKDVFPYLSDDYSSNPDDVDIKSVASNEGIYFIKASVNDDIAGMFMYHPHNSVLYEVHSAVLPIYRGSKSVEMALKSLQWMFKNTNCKKVITYVPRGNKPAFALARRVGMIVEGINRLSIMINGKLIDQKVLGITEEEVLCQ